MKKYCISIVTYIDNTSTEEWNNFLLSNINWCFGEDECDIYINSRESFNVSYKNATLVKSDVNSRVGGFIMARHVENFKASTNNQYEYFILLPSNGLFFTKIKPDTLNLQVTYEPHVPFKSVLVKDLENEHSWGWQRILHCPAMNKMIKQNNIVKLNSHQHEGLTFKYSDYCKMMDCLNGINLEMIPNHAAEEVVPLTLSGLYGFEFCHIMKVTWTNYAYHAQKKDIEYYNSINSPIIGLKRFHRNVNDSLVKYIKTIMDVI